MPQCAALHERTPDCSTVPWDRPLFLASRRLLVQLLVAAGGWDQGMEKIPCSRLQPQRKRTAAACYDNGPVRQQSWHSCDMGVACPARTPALTEWIQPPVWSPHWRWHPLAISGMQLFSEAAMLAHACTAKCQHTPGRCHHNPRQILCNSRLDCSSSPAVHASTGGKVR